MRTQQQQLRRRGSILPLVAICLIALIGMIALGIDLGVLAVARTQCQSAADCSALAGTRLLDGKTANNNKPAAEAFAQTVATNNKVLTSVVKSSQVTVQTGIYSYDPVAKAFVADLSGSNPNSYPWTAMQVTLSTSQPSYFAQLFGLGPFNVGATAVAVHRPRDVAIVLDFSTSMQYSSNVNVRGTTNGGPTSGSMSPDPIYPQFGPWAVYNPGSANAMMATSNYPDRGGEGHALSNLTIPTQNGPPLVGDYLYDTSGGSGAGPFLNAFVGPNADSGAFNNAAGTYATGPLPYIVTPAPDSWTAHPAPGLDGDLWPLDKGKSYVGAPATQPIADWASTVQEVLTGLNTAWPNSTNASVAAKSWDVSGYDFDPKTGNFKAGYTGTPSTSTFKGYTIGPGYYGKTFYVWPPDSRTPVSTPGQAAYVPGDWRQRYFGSGDNSKLWDSRGNWIQGGGTINYANVLAWLKSGPQTLPANLMSGKIVYYSSIPNDCNNYTTNLDQRFWKEYIDFVFAYGRNAQNTTLYGQSSSNGGFGATVKITAQSLLTGSPKPYMHYNDVPIHPRAHFWFGPLTMMAFLAGPPEYGRNWLPGTSHEAHAWHLKAGIQSAIQDIKNNHPNDYAGLVYFSTLSAYNTARVPLGQNYKYLSNALWYPYSLIDAAGNVSGTFRPYDTSFNDLSQGVIPNSNGGTNPTGGFMTAYNEFANNGRRGAAKVVIYETDGVAHDYYDASNYNSGTGVFTFGSNVDEAVSSDVTMRSKTEAMKLAGILCNPTTSPSAFTLTFSDASPTITVNVPATPGFSTARSPVRIHSLAFGELFEPSLASQTTPPGAPGSDMQIAALRALLCVQIASGTSPATDTIQSCFGYNSSGTYTAGTQSFKMIVGNYNTRIDLIRQALQRIMQSGVQVALVQ